MKGAERYGKELEIIFQEMEDKARLQEQARVRPREMFKALLLADKRVQNCLRLCRPLRCR